MVNVAIEGQFLTAAFAAALTGSMTKSIWAALIAAVFAGVLMAALLALFAIKYLVQVVLGVVINLLASGITGFLFDQLVQPNSRALNSAPTMDRISIPFLADLPFVGPVLFQQTILVYLAIVAVVVVWWLLYRTRWGLRVRPSVSTPGRRHRRHLGRHGCAGRRCWWRASSRAWAGRSSPWARWACSAKT